MFSIDDCRRLVEGLDHPECVAVGRDGLVYAGGEAGQIYRFSLESLEVEVIADVGGFVAGVTIFDDDSLIVCDAGNGRLVRVDSGAGVYPLTEGIGLSFPNFAAFDLRGNLYFTDSGDYYGRDGRLLALRPGGEVEVLVAAGLAYPNGLAVDEDRDWLYLAESTGPDILRYRLERPDWAHPEVFVELPKTVPDGLAMAENGSIYVGCYSPDVILRVSPKREVTTVVADPGADMLNRPTNVAFAGTTLLFANLGGHHIGALEVGERGLAIHRPRA